MDIADSSFIAHPNVQFVFRLILMIVILIFLALASFTNILPAKHIDCIEDKVFEYTEGLNLLFTLKVFAKYVFLIICGTMMDILIVSQMIYFLFYQKSWRWLFAMIMFYGCRGII